MGRRPADSESKSSADGDASQTSETVPRAAEIDSDTSCSTRSPTAFSRSSTKEYWSDDGDAVDLSAVSEAAVVRSCEFAVA